MPLGASALEAPKEKDKGGQFETLEGADTFGSGVFTAFFSLVTFEVQFQPQTVGAGKTSGVGKTTDGIAYGSLSRYTLICPKPLF